MMALGSDTTSSINLARQYHLTVSGIRQKTQVQICQGNAAASSPAPEGKQKVWDHSFKKKKHSSSEYNTVKILYPLP